MWANGEALLGSQNLCGVQRRWSGRTSDTRSFVWAGAERPMNDKQPTPGGCL